MNWTKLLNKKELTHVRTTAGCKSLEQFKQNRKEQHELSPDKEVCWDCRSVALKLGLEK